MFVIRERLYVHPVEFFSLRISLNLSFVAITARINFL